MILRTLALTIGAIALLSLLSEQPQAQSSGPEDTVKALYASYGIGPPTPGKDGIGEDNAASFFSKSLLALYKRAISLQAIDADFFCQCQDFSLTKPIEINSISTEGSISKISATLTQAFDKKKPMINKFVFRLVKEPEGWRISDAFTDGRSVVSEWNAAIHDVQYCRSKKKYHC